MPLRGSSATDREQRSGAGATTDGSSEWRLRIDLGRRAEPGQSREEPTRAHTILCSSGTLGAGGIMRRVECWRCERPIARDVGSRSDHGLELNSVARVVANDIRRRSHDVRGQIRRAERDERNPSAGGGPGSGFTASKFATAAVDTGKLEIWRIDHPRSERTSAGDLDGLRAVMRFIAAGAAGSSQLRRRRDLPCGEVRRRCNR